MLRNYLLILALLLGFTGCDSQTASPASDQVEVEPADWVLYGGTVISLDDQIGTVDAIAMTDHTITAVGSEAEIKRYIGDDTNVLNLEGATVIPGLIEGHGHFLSLGRSMQILRLDDAKNFSDIVNQVAQAADAAPEGTWIFGRGWHQEKWETVPDNHLNGEPINDALNRVAADHPVLLGHASGHAALANNAALAAAGIGDETADPAGGEIVRDADGRATGVLRERAQELVEQAAERAMSKLPEEQQAQIFREQVELAGREALRYGITSFHDAGTPFKDIDALRALETEGQLPVRLYVMVGGETVDAMRNKLADYVMRYEDNDFLTVTSIKQQIDGALGAHGAWLAEPYTDKPDSVGLTLTTVEALREVAELARTHDFQLNTHAIGTRANQETLNVYAEIWQDEQVSGAGKRWRIEHAQHILPADIPRFAELGVIAAVQGVHCTSDGPWIPTRLGEPRTQLTSYRWRDLIDSGARINNGTDAPVESLNPFASLDASVNRVMGNGKMFYPEQAMTREEALRSYTIDNAYSAFEEQYKGTLTPGKLADIAILDDNPLTANRLGGLTVKYTFVAGELRYRADSRS